MARYDIAVIPGDGTGPEVVAEGIKVLQAAAKKFGFELNLEYFDLGGDRYLKTGAILSESEIERLKQKHAIYLGAIGHPGVAGDPGGILLRLRLN